MWSMSCCWSECRDRRAIYLPLDGLLRLIRDTADGLSLIHIWQSLLIMRISNKRIGGHTGDVLGAIECLAELTLLLVTLVVTIYA